MAKKITKNILLLIIFIIIISCDPDNSGNAASDPNLAKITFFNNSKYPVDIFYNFNPQSFDPTSFIGTADTISRKLVVEVPASSDTFLGDTFYLRYKILLANRFDTGTNDLYIHAERTMSNISFVVEKGRSYTKSIEDPPDNELRFVNGVVKVFNLTTDQYWIENFGVILPQMGREDPWLTLGQFGFYEITIPFLSESLLMDSLKIRDNQTNRVSFPSFEMERGKLYYFEIKNTGISGPVVSPVNPLAK